MKHIPIRLFKLALVVGFLTPVLLQGQEERNYYRRAPDVLPGTLPGMRTPEFWIAKCDESDKVILSPEQITQMNEDFRERMKNLSLLEKGLGKAIEKEISNWSGVLASPPDLDACSPQERFSITREMAEAQIRQLRKKDHGNLLGIEYADWEIDAFEKEMAIDQIGSLKEIQYGITVRDCRIRVIPTLRPEHVALGNTGRARWDMFNLDLLPISKPVQILHISASGGYLLVLSSRGYGWIRSEDIALAGKDRIEAYCNRESFLVCTGEKTPYYTDSACRITSGWIRMGDRLPCLETGDRLQVMVPLRNIDGSLDIEKAWLKKDADVSRGFLLYTKKNISRQTFKLLDLVYDYTGAWFGRNHATILRDLFACFGFELPGNGVMLKAYRHAGSISPDAGKKEQYRAINSNEPFVTIQISGGHSQLFLGTHEGTPYVFDTHGYTYTGEDGQEYVIRRSCIYTPELPGYMLKNELFFVKLR